MKQPRERYPVPKPVPGGHTFLQKYFSSQKSSDFYVSRILLISLSLSLSLSLCRFHVFARIDDTRDAFGMIARSFFSAFLSGGVLARDGPFACVARHGRACLAAEGMCCADFLFARERKEETGRHRDATSILLVRMDRL